MGSNAATLAFQVKQRCLEAMQRLAYNAVDAKAVQVNNNTLRLLDRRNNTRVTVTITVDRDWEWEEELIMGGHDDHARGYGDYT